MPIYWNDDWSSEHHLAYTGHTYHIGFYVERASVSLKVQKIFTFITSLCCWYGAVLLNPLDVLFLLVKAIWNFHTLLLFNCYGVKGDYWFANLNFFLDSNVFCNLNIAKLK
jgi:hypothetical protein